MIECPVNHGQTLAETARRSSARRHADRPRDSEERPEFHIFYGMQAPLVILVITLSKLSL